MGLTLRLRFAECNPHIVTAEDVEMCLTFNKVGISSQLSTVFAHLCSASGLIRRRSHMRVMQEKKESGL